MTLKERIQADLKQAQLNRDGVEVQTLRLLWSELHNVEIEKSHELSDGEIVPLVQREIKKRREAAEGFRQGGRTDSAEKEEAEAAVLAAYLPEQLSKEELEKIIDEEIAASGASSIQEMGKVIGAVMGKVVGRAEGSSVSGLVKEKLTAEG